MWSVLFHSIFALDKFSEVLNDYKNISVQFFIEIQVSNSSFLLHGKFQVSISLKGKEKNTKTN